LIRNFPLPPAGEGGALPTSIPPEGEGKTKGSCFLTLTLTTTLVFRENPMRAVIQRVSRAKVEVEARLTGQIGKGLLVLLGVGRGDSPKEADHLLEKIINLRIFEDSQGKLNLSLLDIRGELMVISQFTLYADCRKGRRPSFTDAAPPETAKALYEYFLQRAKSTGLGTAAGVFQAMMEVELVNSGPVTILLDSSRNF